MTKHTTVHPMKAFRLAEGLTQVQAAKRLGVSQNFICRLERGEVWCRPSTAKRISDATGIALDRLLNFGDDEKVVHAGK